MSPTFSTEKGAEPANAEIASVVHKRARRNSAFADYYVYKQHDQHYGQSYQKRILFHSRPLFLS